MKNKFEGKFDSLYKLTKSDWVFESTFANLMKYVDKICEQALNIENDDFLLLHNSLQLYEKVSKKIWIFFFFFCVKEVKFLWIFKIIFQFNIRLKK